MRASLLSPHFPWPIAVRRRLLCFYTSKLGLGIFGRLAASASVVGPGRPSRQRGEALHDRRSDCPGAEARCHVGARGPAPGLGPPAAVGGLLGDSGEEVREGRGAGPGKTHTVDAATATVFEGQQVGRLGRRKAGGPAPVCDNGGEAKGHSLSRRQAPPKPTHQGRRGGRRGQRDGERARERKRRGRQSNTNPSVWIWEKKRYQYRSRPGETPGAAARGEGRAGAGAAAVLLTPRPS